MKAKKSFIALVLSAVLMLSAISFSSFTTMAAESVLLQGAGYETIYIEWSGVSGTDYNVYSKESSQADSAYKKVDAELVRNVKDNMYRVDVLGLKGGTSYDVKVVPVTGGTEGNAVITYTATPEAYDRSGFAFTKNDAPGAYNADGTVADGTLIIYATEQNKSKVYNGKSLTSLLGGFNSLNGGKPVIIRVIGKITPVGSATSPGMWKNTCGVTIEGVGPGSGFSGWGIGSGDNKDTEFRNMNFVDYVEDAIGFENAEDLWIHNNTFYSGWNPKDSTAERDKLHGDGSCDLRECNNVTVSYNHFDGTDKTSLIGSSSTSRESTGNITFHHNFFDGTSQRTPRVRWHNIHIYNNYYYGTTSYGVGATCNCSIFAENNYFEDASSPFLTSSQGGFASKFSDNEGGVIKAYNNVMVNTRESKEGVDYFNAPSREYRMTGSDFTAAKGGWTYNNFDASGYIAANNYIRHTPEEAKSIVMAKSGAMKGTNVTEDTIAPPEVTGNVTAVYYYDPEASGSTGTAFGGINGTGTFFKGANASCSSKNASGYRGTEPYSYSGSFATGSEVSFTISAAAKFTIIASTSGNTPQRAEVKGPNVYHGYFQTGNNNNDVITTINLLEPGTYSFKPSNNIDIYYMEVAEYDGEIPDTPETTTSAVVEATTQATTSAVVESTTQATTQAPVTDTTPVEMGTPENNNGAIDGGTATVTYNEPTDTWYLADTSSTEAANLIIPFKEPITTGKIIFTGKVTPSSNNSKWGFLRIVGTVDGAANQDVAAFASDTGKNVALRTGKDDNDYVYTSASPAAAIPSSGKEYSYVITIDMDAKTATLKVDGITGEMTHVINAEAITGVGSTTSKKDTKRTVTLTTPYVGIPEEAPAITEASTQATTEATTQATTEATTQATTEATTQATTEATTQATTEKPEPFEPLYGNANGNGSVEISDVSALFGKVLTGVKMGIEEATDDFMKYVDVDADGSLTSKDVAMVLQKILDSSYKLPVEE